MADTVSPIARAGAPGVFRPASPLSAKPPLSRARFVYRCALALMLLPAFLGPPTPAFADENLPGKDCDAVFTCDPGTSPQCWFTIAMSSGTKTFTVPAGHSQTIYGLTRGDVVCTSNTGPPPDGPAGNCRDINMHCARQ
jgi:hypothetical protein